MTQGCLTPTPLPPRERGPPRIPHLLEVDDILIADDEKVIMAFISEFFALFSKQACLGGGGEGAASPGKRGSGPRGCSCGRPFSFQGQGSGCPPPAGLPTPALWGGGEISIQLAGFFFINRFSPCWFSTGFGRAVHRAREFFSPQGPPLCRRDGQRPIRGSNGGKKN